MPLPLLASLGIGLGASLLGGALRGAAKKKEEKQRQQLASSYVQGMKPKTPFYESWGRLSPIDYAVGRLITQRSMAQLTEHSGMDVGWMGDIMGALGYNSPYVPQQGMPKAPLPGQIPSPRRGSAGSFFRGQGAEPEPPGGRTARRPGGGYRGRRRGREEY